MRRALTAGLVAAVVLPSAVLAASGVGPRPAALPTPLVTEPRLAYADSEQSLVSVLVSDPPEQEDPEIPEIERGPGGAGAGLGARAPVGARTVLPAFGDLDVESIDPWDAVEQDHRYDAEASVQQPDGRPAGRFETQPPTAFVSARHLPEGDVYLRYEPSEELDSGVVRITCDAAVDSHPVISPDGAWLAWATTRDGTWSIVRASLDDLDFPDDLDWCEEVGDRAEPVTTGDFDETWPAWTSDSDRIVYSSTESDPLGDLWSVSTDTLVPVRLTSGTAAESQPTVSPWGDPVATVAFSTTQFRPDGSIALVGIARDGEPASLFEGNDGEVVDIYPPGSGTTEYPNRVQGSEPTFGQVDDVAWLAWTSRELDPAGDVWIGFLDDGAVGIGVMFQEPVIARLGRAEMHPSWGSVFESDEGGTPAARLTFTDAPRLVDIHDVRADGSGDLRVLAQRTEQPPPDQPSAPSPEPLHELSPAYRPAGDALSYASENAVAPEFGDWILTQVVRTTPADANAGVVEDYPAGPFDAEPAWSPDGTRLAFARSPDPAGNAPTLLYVADFRTSPATVTQVTQGGTGETFEDHDPTWTPDGSRLFFSRWSLTDRGTGVPASERYAVEATTIWSVAASGTTPAQPVVVSDPCAPLALCPRVLAGRSPTLSPDGTRLAVVDLGTRTPNAEGNPFVGVAPGGIGIVTLGPTAGAPVVQSAVALTGIRSDGTATPARLVVDGTDNPAWSPDGSEVAFSAHRAGQPQQRGIWAVSSADGSGLHVVTDTQGTQDEPAYRPYADLAVTLDVTPSADGSATLVVSVSNAGPGLVDAAQVDVELPPGLSTTGVPGCTVTGQQLTCPLSEPLPPGRAPVVLAVPVQGVSTTVGPITAVVTSTSPERDVTDNTASITPTVAQGVAVTLTVTPPTLWVGGLPATATFTVTNLGPQSLGDVTLTTTFPPFVTTAGSPSAPCTQASGTCTLGTLGPRDTATLTTELRSVDFAGPPQTGQVTGAVTTSSPDPAPGDDTASAPVEVRAPELSASPGVARPGGVVFVAGRWFPPGEPVRLGWQPGIMSVPGPYPVQPDGTFQASVPVVADTILGPRRLVGTGTTPGPAFGAVEVPVLINPSSVAAPDFLFRR